MSSLVRPFIRILGVILAIIGLMGFFMESPLLGIFEVDMVHNIIHLASGAIAILVGGNQNMSRVFLIIFGLVYGVVAVTGFMQETTVFNIFVVNMADNILHAAIAASCLVVGFGSRS